MKNTTRLLAFMLSFVMLLCFLPQSILAQFGGASANEADEALTDLPVFDDPVPEAYVLGEVAENRTETSKTFRMSDGSYIAADYGKAIHYSDENGEWQDYDNTLAYPDIVTYDAEDFAGYITSDSDIAVKLANNSNSNNLLKIIKGDYEISLHLVGANKSKALELYPAEEEPTGNDIASATKLHKFSSGATYKDILPSTDLEYIIYGNSVKENIIIKEKLASYAYTFELKLNSLVPVIQNDGSIALNDAESSETVLVIPKGYMYDANGESSTSVNYAIAHKNGNKYTLTVTADSDWINAKERAFPVTIDPTVEGYDSSVSTYDSYISQNSPDLNDYLRTEIISGYYGGNTSKECHALIRAASLPQIPKSAVIVNATMQVTHLVNGTEHTSVNIAAVQIAESWDSNNVTWNTKPDYAADGIIYDYKSINASSEGQEIGFDITELARKWYNGTANYGIALIPIAGNGNGRIYFGSSDYVAAAPSLLIQYRDTKGLENIWTYTAQSAGNAGTGYVNGYNGNLVFVHNDLTTKGAILPVTVSHVYNSSLAGKQFTKNENDINAPVTSAYGNMLIGYGWKLSLQETIVAKTINNATYYVHNDADGTEHYYALSGDKYMDESGSGLELVIGSNGTEKYKIADEYGNTKSFNTNGYVTKITDVHGNVKSFSYNSNNQLTNVIATNVGQAATAQLAFAYNNLGALKRITDTQETDKYVEFYYSSGYIGPYSTEYSGYLRKIQYYNNGSTIFYSTYEYDSNGYLVSATDSESNYKLTYSYTQYNGSPRVIGVSESVGTESGQQIGFDYKDRAVEIRQSGNDDIYNNGDDILTTYLFDYYGRAICAYSSDVNKTEIYGTSYAEYTQNETFAKTNNKVKTEAAKGKTNENIFLDGNVTSLNSWSDDSVGTGYSVSHDTSNGYIGNDSLKLQSLSGGNGVAWLFDTFTVYESGEYTFSAYIKTENVVATSSTGGFSLSLDADPVEFLTGSTNTAVNNGWRRISVTKNLTAGTHFLDITLTEATGTVYVDCIQVEKASTPSKYNLIVNSGFRTNTAWSGNYTINASVDGRSYAAKLNGNVAAENRITQTVLLNSPLTTTFVLSGWGKANSVALSDTNRKFGIIATLTYSDNSTAQHLLSFNPENTDWQYAATAIVPKTENNSLTVVKIDIALAYDYNANTAYFDEIALTVEPAQTYVYDSHGNLKTVTDAEGNESGMEYYDNQVDIKEYTSELGELLEYTYNDKHQITNVYRTANGYVQTASYKYDDFGNTTSAIMSIVNNNGTIENMTTLTEYTDDGNYLVKSINELDAITTYAYTDVEKLLMYIENANSKRIAFIYNDYENASTVYLDSDKDGVVDTADPAVNYLYSSGRLSGINTATTSYTLTYSAFGELLTIKAGNNTLASYEYTANNGKLKKLTYGNGDYEEYIYDNLDRLTAVKYNGITEYSIKYDCNGQIYELLDGTATHIYEYDSLGRLIRAYQKDSSGNIILEVENSFDEYGRAKGSDMVVGDKEMSYEINYKADSNLVGSISMPESSKISSIVYSYDGFERVTQKRINISTPIAFYEDYGYYTYTDADNQVHTSSLVSDITLRVGSSGNVATYSYTYDNLGNILSISENGTVIRSYEYDSLGQLIRENNIPQNYTKLYLYDNSGNIQSQISYAYSTAPTFHMLQLPGSETSYTYSNSAWGDLLANYNGTAINYDTIGNPLNWRNATSLTWEARELTSLMLSNDDVLSFTYDSSGIRTQKRVFDNVCSTYKTYDYLLDGNTILSETVYDELTGSEYTLYYLYDASSSIQGFIYNNTYYYFQKNLQGDVVRILNSSGNIVTEYTYDAWGNILSVSGSMASTIGQYNPFRYRGYYYDSETGWYYLNSRYYDPVVGRFLNADGIIGANGGIEGYNMFAYCNNNPILYLDDAGYAVRTYNVRATDGAGGGNRDYSSYTKESTNTNQSDTPASNSTYINEQRDDALIDTQKMKDISFGLGNIAKNGCGVIAAYNVLITWDVHIEFNKVKNEIVALGGAFFGGKLGTDPVVLTGYMISKYTTVIAAPAPTFLWGPITRNVDAVIVLVKWNDWVMHYFAGINMWDGTYVFYNSGLYDESKVSIDGKAIPFDKLLEYIKNKDATALYIIGVIK